MKNMNIASGMIGAGIIGGLGLAAFSASASVDTTSSKTATQVVPAQTAQIEQTQDKTASSNKVEIKEATLACMACSNI
nr:hypothetical protein VW1_00061 [Enterobacter sp.]